MPVDTIPRRLLEQARQRPEKPAYYVKRGSSWRATSWKEYVAQVRAAARALLAMGFEPGETVCILGFNCPEWVVLDVAAMCLGGAPAGIYTTCSASEVGYIIDHSEARVVLVEDLGQWEKIRAQREAGNVSRLERVILLKGEPPADEPMVITWDAFLATGQQSDDARIDERIDKLEAAQLATLIYTSGTTGPPKAVMLSHENLAWTARCAVDLVGGQDTDSSLSYLPLSHIAEQMFTIHVPATTGMSIYYAESIEKVADNLKEVQPTIVFGVPRIWEKFYSGIKGKLAVAPPLKQKLVSWASGIGRKVFDLRAQGKEPTGLLAVQYRLAEKAIFGKLKPAVGLGRARICVTGAAPISREILEFFAGLDIAIHEVYGQSEGSGPTTFNTPGRIKLGTVGAALPGVEVKTLPPDKGDPDGEIVVRGPNVFLGYYKDEAATQETLIDGWLHSGDLGRFDADGFLSITGRKKEILITSGGKNITPKNIELAIKNDPLITEAVVIGDARKYLTALVCLDPDAAARFATEHDLSPEQVTSSKEAREHVQRVIDAVNREFARVEQIKRFTILPRPLDVEHGELTPSLKVKRRVVNQNFKDEIEAMYADAGE